MPVTITFDIEDASVKDVNDRGRIYAAFQRLGWENIGGSAWRYPALVYCFRNKLPITCKLSY